MIFVKERKEGKEYFNTGLLNSTSLMGNLRLQTAANLMGPMLRIKHTLQKQAFWAFGGVLMTELDYPLDVTETCPVDITETID